MGITILDLTTTGSVGTGYFVPLAVDGTDENFKFDLSTAVAGPPGENGNDGGPGPTGPDGPPGSVDGVDALGLVLAIMPPATGAGVYASFNTNTTGNYYYAGRGDTTISDWLAIATGTFTRSGTAEYVTSAGLTALAATDIPRLTYDPVTLAPLGLLNEPAATNLWPYSNKGDAAGASAWLFSPTAITMVDNNATGTDGTSSAFTIRETAVTSAHSAFYYPGAGVVVTSGHFYAAQFRIKPAGRTKFTVAGNAATGMPDTTVDTVAMTATNGYILQAWNSGYYLLYRKFTGAGAGTDVVYFQLGLNDGTGASSYLGDITKGIDVDNVMFSEIASLTAPLPSMVKRPGNTAATRNADLLNITLPSGATSATYTFSDGTQQIVTVASGPYNFPTTLTGGIIKSFITADLSVVGTLVTSVFGRTGAVTGAQADIAGLTTASSPTFVGATLSGKTLLLGTAVLKMDTSLTLWAPATATGFLAADRGTIIARSQAKPSVSFSNSVSIGIDSAASATTLATSVIIGDTASGGSTTITGVVAIGNEAGNGPGNNTNGNVIGNATKFGGSAGNNNKFDIIGQTAFQFMRAVDTVAVGWAAGKGSAGTPGSHTQSVLLGSMAGTNLVGDRTGNILVGYNIQAPTTTTDNHINIGDTFIATRATNLAVRVGGTGTPEGAVTAAIGSLYTRADGGAGTTLYVKESGSGNTGWVAK